MQKKILVIGTFDSKREEYEFLVSGIVRMGGAVIAIDVGTFSQGRSLPNELVDSQEWITPQEIMQLARFDLESVRASGDRGQAMQAMAKGAAIKARELFAAGKVSGVVGMGGSGGSSVISAAMQNLPIGIPKVLLSTMAGGETSSYVGCKDVVLIPSVTDISGLNRISCGMMTTTAAAIVAMASEFEKREDDLPVKKVIAASMFGNTTDCVNLCRAQLEDHSTEVIVFHATGTGGKTMEALIDDGHVDGCLDITTTEIADEVCGGILSAGPDRLGAAGRNGIPHLVVPGCIDMANFGGLESVPAKFRDGGRQLYPWNPAVTLMRTNVEENIQMGAIFAEKLNAARGPVRVVLPLRGVSILDGDHQRFCDRQADQAMFDTLKSKLNPGIRVDELDCNINDREFAETAVSIFRGMMDSVQP